MVDNCSPDLPDTQSQTPSSQNSEITQEINRPWGRLSACNPSLSSLDLFEQSYSCGRSPHCNIVISNNVSQFNTGSISKIHFELTKEDDIVFLTDFSKNGTFINKRKVGKDNRFILNTNDVISLGHPNSRAFIFNCNTHEEQVLPSALRNGYFVSRVLGKGAAGEVRYALDKQTCEPYAIKRIVKGSVSRTGLVNHPSKILTEIKILQNFKHPFIISMKEVFESDKEVFLVLEYMKGGDLRERILSPLPFPEAEVKFVFYQMLLAIQYLHNHGVTHRDLKPENVLLVKDGHYPQIKISDFGLSKIMDEQSMMNTICGTVFYAAPEILSYSNSYTKKVDVWSLGVILFYMLSKRLPFLGTDRENTSRKIVRGSYDSNILKGISETAKDLIKKMLTKYQSRISVNEIFQHPWIERDMVTQYRVKELTDNGDDSTSTLTPSPKRARYTT